MEQALQRLIDREEIRDLLARYARGVDRADWDLVRAVYHEDAYDDHGAYKGGVEGFIAFLEERSRPLPQSMHFLGNCLIEFASDEVAAVETYFMTAHTLLPRTLPDGSEEPVPSQLSSYGRYVDRMERRGGPWRIAHRTVVAEANRLHGGKTIPVKPERAQLRRDPDDPIFRLRAELGITG